MCSVTVNANRGKDESTEMEVAYGTVLNLDTPEYDGYRFLGWYDAEKNEFDARTQAVQKSMTLTAEWEKVDSFNVVFSYLDGTTKSVTKEVAYGEAVTAPDEVTVDGLEFYGWYKGDSTFDPQIFLGSPYDFSTKVKGDIYLYARYNLSEEKLTGSWEIPLSELEILEDENGKKTVKVLLGKDEDMVEVGTWDYDETEGSLKAEFTGKYAFYLTGMMPMFQENGVGEKGENLLTTTLSYSPSYTYTSAREPSEGNVKGIWTRTGDTLWTSTVEFGDTEATEKFLLYSSAEAKEKAVSTTEFTTKYQSVEENGMVTVVFVPSMQSMLGYDDAVATFSTSVTYATGVDTFYAAGFMGDTFVPFTRVTE